MSISPYIVTFVGMGEQMRVLLNTQTRSFSNWHKSISLKQTKIQWFSDDSKLELQLLDENTLVYLKDLKRLPTGEGAFLNQLLCSFWPSKENPFPLELFPSIQGYGAPLLDDKNSKSLNYATFFGGTFNPWHEGHQACIENFNKNSSHDKKEYLIVVPDHNPQKELAMHPCYWAEYQWMKRKISKFPNCYVYPGFCGIYQANPTSSWIGKLSLHPSLLMGDDSFQGLSSWINVKKILETVNRIYVVPRIYNIGEFEQMKKTLNLVGPQQLIVLLANHPFQHLSSTLLRKKISYF